MFHDCPMCCLEEAEKLLERAADSLQWYCGDINGDMNDSVAMNIFAWLDKQKQIRSIIICKEGGSKQVPKEKTKDI